jgi:hypothetical protein
VRRSSSCRTVTPASTRSSAALEHGPTRAIQSNKDMILSIDHIQIAMPAGEEEKARAFYISLLGFTEIPKPPELAMRGGVWFRSGPTQLHLGVEPDFRPARKAPPAFIVDHRMHCSQTFKLQDSKLTPRTLRWMDTNAPISLTRLGIALS